MSSCFNAMHLKSNQMVSVSRYFKRDSQTSVRVCCSAIASRAREAMEVYPNFVSTNVIT